MNVEHSTGGVFAIQQVDSAGTEWKLVFSSGDGTTTANTYDPTVGITDFTRVQLYNLTADPGEQANLLGGGGSRKSSAQGTATAEVYAVVYLFGPKCQHQATDARSRLGNPSWRDNDAG